MILKEHVSLAPFTTFHIGGEARFLVEARSEEDVNEAITFARAKNLPLYPLGGGSNVLLPDKGVDGIVVHIKIYDAAFISDGGDTLLSAGAGARWDTLVDMAGARGLFGIENLAGIPGTLGGAAVQNIGAYGAELKNVFEYADTITRTTGEHRRITLREAGFGYRTSICKENRDLIITRVALRLSPEVEANISYPDLIRMRDAGEPLATPEEIARVVRAIRAQKFPQGGGEGTAGSFFKNPIVSRELADSLATRYLGLPVFPQENNKAKISLAWLLDHALALKGYEVGKVRLYEKQPIVIVARAGATAREVDAFANDIAERVFRKTGIAIEREVETLSEKFSA